MPSLDALANRGIRAVCVLALGGALAAGLSVRVVAADPTPVPVVFNPPQLLVWEDNHGTYDGPVVDNVYALVPNSEVDPKNNGHFILPDGNGGVFHYFGHIIDGPFGGSNDLCPKMIALGIDSVSDLPGYNSLSTAQCQAFLAPIVTAPPAVTDDPYAATTATVDPNAGGYVTTGSPSDPGSPDPIALEIATALILALLGIGSLRILGAIFHLGPFARPAIVGANPSAPSGASPVVYGPSPAPEPAHTQSSGQPHPCAAQMAALEAASAHGRGINSILATLREFHAGLDQQIVLIEKAEIPATIGVDTAFLVGGQIAGKLGPGFLPDTILGKIVDGLAKDQAKSLIKKTLGSGAFGLSGKLLSGGASAESAAKSTLKAVLKDSLSDHYASASMKGFRGSSFELLNTLPGKWKAADKIAGSMADAMGHLLTLYSSGASLATMVQQSAILRQKAMAVYGDIAELQEEFTSALEAQHFAADRLTHCQVMNAPGRVA
jgi:hypothetical protein